MSRRRAQAAASSTRVAPDLLPVSARVAWSYLAAMLSAIAAGILVLISNQSLAVLWCQSAGDLTGECKLGWAIWAGLGGFLLASIPISLAVKLDWWLIVSLWSGVGLWVAFDAIDSPYWWVSSLVVPGLAALASADWQRGTLVRRVQLGSLALLGVAAIGALVWWYLRG